jgi:non-ribosomal peptide synthetase component F
LGNLLGDIEEPTTPFGLTQVQRDGHGVEEARALLSSALNTRLRLHARRLSVSLASLCHLAWGQVVARTSGREKVVFGTVLCGRVHRGADAEHATGPFGNVLPMRLNLDDTGVEASVRQTHPSYPRERLQELVSDADPVLTLVDAAGRQALALVAVC